MDAKSRKITSANTKIRTFKHATFHTQTLVTHSAKADFVATCFTLPPQNKCVANNLLNQIARHHFYKVTALDWASSQNDVTTVAKGNLDLPLAGR